MKDASTPTDPELARAAGDLSEPSQEAAGVGAPDPDPPRVPEPAPDRGLRVLLPIAVGLLVAAAWVSDRGVIRHDLQIVAPNFAAPGDSLPARAFLFERTEGVPEPRSLADATLRLVPLEGGRTVFGPRGQPRTVARGEVHAAEVIGLEGGLDLPRELAPGDYRLLGVATVDERQLVVSRRVHVADPPNVMERRGRLQTDVQRFEVGPLRAWTERDDEVMGAETQAGTQTETETETATRESVDLALLSLVRLEVRVVGGDCSPPVPCELLVDTGPAALAVRLREGSTWLDAGSECDGSTPRAGIVRCSVSGSANARVVDAVAFDEGRPIARRRVQLPLGTAAPAIVRAPTLVPLGSTPELAIRGVLDERAGYVVDLFHDERWLHTQSVAVSADEPFALSRALDRPGLWRVQVRTEPFAADHAATRLIFVGTLTELAASGYPEAWGVASMPEDADAERVARFVLAAGELELVTMPGLTRGAQQAEAGLHETQGIRRWGAAILVMLAGLLVAIAIVRRGLRADVEATRLMEAAGAIPEPRSKGPVYGAGLFTLMLFAAVAAMVLSRGCL